MNHHVPLPDLLEEVANAIGVEAALKLAADKGGTEVYIPSNPNPQHWLSLLLGHENAVAMATALVSARTGLKLVVPLGPSRDQVTRWRRMHLMIDKGHSAREIARACGVHMRTVKRHRMQRGSLRRVNAQLAQLSLFE
jgi:DNA-binding NarL/FixJ family response regulator